MAKDLLDLDGGIDSVITDFPHGAGGGWDDVDPSSDFWVYAQVAELEGIAAVATGTNKVNRVRAVCVTLVMAVAVALPDLISDDQLAEYHPDLPAWVAAARVDLKEVGVLHSQRHAREQNQKAATSGPKSRSRVIRSRSPRHVRGAGEATGSNDLERRVQSIRVGVEDRDKEIDRLVRDNAYLERKLKDAEGKLKAIRDIAGFVELTF